MQEQMKNKILYTDEARCDLDSIWDYIALDLQNQQAAERLVNKIMDRVDQLEDFAESGMLLSSISEVIGEERFLVCENYLIFYHTGKSVVTVDRVLYGRRDYLSVLFDKTREEPFFRGFFAGRMSIKTAEALPERAAPPLALFFGVLRTGLMR